MECLCKLYVLAMVGCRSSFDAEFVFGLKEEDLGSVLGFWPESLNGLMSFGLCLCLCLVL